MFVDYFGSILLTNIEKPLSYFRNVDEIFISIKTDYHVDALFDQISNLHPTLKLTR